MRLHASLCLCNPLGNIQHLMYLKVIGKEIPNLIHSTRINYVSSPSFGENRKLEVGKREQEMTTEMNNPKTPFQLQYFQIR